jgi:ABC-type glutathione transport system ATPase component
LRIYLSTAPFPEDGKDTPRCLSGGEQQRAVSIIYRDCAKERRED